MLIRNWGDLHGMIVNGNKLAVGLDSISVLGTARKYKMGISLTMNTPAEICKGLEVYGIVVDYQPAVTIDLRELCVIAQEKRWTVDFGCNPVRVTATIMSGEITINLEAHGYILNLK